MNISIEKKIFSEAVHIASRFAERKNATLPALSSILIISGDDGIKMRATNLETAVDLKLEGESHDQGVVAPPAILLQQIASSLTSQGTLTLEHIGDSVSLVSGTNKSLLRTVSCDDFPSIPFPENTKNALPLPGIVLRTLFSSVGSCASSSMVRPELASICLSIEGGVLTSVATDSFRLAEKKIPIANKGVQGKMLLPAKNALDLAQAFPDDEVILSFDEHQCVFTSTKGMFVSRLTNAVYPDYRQIIPKESVAEAIVLRKDFENALKQTAVFSDAFQKVRIHFDAKKNSISLFSKNADIGESAETLPARLSGNSLELSFNHRYLSTILSLTQTESISLVAAGVGRPLVMKGVGDSSLLYLVSPMNQ